MKAKVGIVLLLIMAMAMPIMAADNPYMAAATEAARWLRSNAIKSDGGLVWAGDPADPKTVSADLYYGSSGPVLFFLQMYRSTGDKTYLETARSGADALIPAIPKTKHGGLYAGVAGIGFALGEMYLTTKDSKYRNGALQCVQALRDLGINTKNGGMYWKAGNDIIYGTSGTGLFLLWADRQLKAPGARELAIAAGKQMLNVAETPSKGKMRWQMGQDALPGEDLPEMPGFSHGTAGVAYFLATLYQQTGQKEFLDASLAAASYLLSIATTDKDSCVIYHDDRRKELYYLGWCHGPAGTTRLFYRLHLITKDPQWMTLVKKGLNGMIKQGGPIRAVLPGEWDSVSPCCGVAGETDYLLSMYRLLKDKQYLELAKKGCDNMLTRATKDEKGMRWVQSEVRVQPKLLIAQTGLLQGAAGIGMTMLNMNAAMHGKNVVSLPDNPF